MDNITVNWGVNVGSGIITIELEEMNIDTMEDWESLSEEDQKEKLQDALNEHPEQPFMVVDKFTNE